MPAVVGVPVIAPVVAFRLKPGGRVPLLIENVYGEMPPVAVSEELYGCPTVPVVAGGHCRLSGGAMLMLQFAVALLPAESTTLAVKL